jgi:hypothetical protein
MDIRSALQLVDASTAKAFVSAARHVIDALLIEGERVRQAQGPGSTDYATAELSREGPAGGWISDEELRDTTKRLAEAIAAEKWTDGVLFAVQLLSRLGG